MYQEIKRVTRINVAMMGCLGQWGRSPTRSHPSGQNKLMQAYTATNEPPFLLGVPGNLVRRRNPACHPILLFLLAKAKKLLAKN
jgi:hypothetical protein